MADDKLQKIEKSPIEVQVCFATEKEYWLKTVSLPPHSTVAMAIKTSGVIERFPEIDVTLNKIGIFSELVTLDHEVFIGDRVEIYRPLQSDPKDLRKQRALHQKKQKKKGKTYF